MNFHFVPLLAHDTLDRGSGGDNINRISLNPISYVLPPSRAGLLP